MYGLNIFQMTSFIIVGNIRPCYNPTAIAVYVGCIYDPMISVRVLRLFHNNWVGYSLMYLLLWILYNLSIPNYNYVSGASLYQLVLLTRTKTKNSKLNSCTVLCSSLNMGLRQVSLVRRSGSLVGAHDLWWGSLLQCS